jgi:hypothetical protein
MAAVALVACGGASSDTSGSTSTAATQRSAGEGGSNGGGGSQPAKTDSGAKPGRSNGSPQGSASGSSAAVVPLKVSGGGSAQFRTKGGDNSIQEYGAEGDESELRQAAEAVHGFYAARAEEEWSKACSYLSASTAKQLETLASRSPKLKGKGCGAILATLTQPLPPSVERETTEVDAASLRHEGEHAFLIYRGMENKVYAITMVQEGGGWKVGSLAALPIG